MARQMFDAIHDYVSAIPDVTDDLVAGYDTGTQDIKWTQADWDKFPGTVVHVDQAYGGPVRSATVMDVEAGAYKVEDIPGWIAACTAARPTCYVNQSELASVLSITETADIWLAAPGMSDTEALAVMKDNPRIVAVQNQWSKTFDRSIVGDPYWPEKAPVTTPPVTTPVTTPPVTTPPVTTPPVTTPPVTTPPVTTPPAISPPTGVRGTALSSLSQVNIAWNSAPGPAPYSWQVERETSPGTWALEQSGTTTATIASVHNLSPRQSYRFRVSNGSWSGWVTVSTP